MTSHSREEHTGNSDVTVVGCARDAGNLPLKHPDPFNAWAEDPLTLCVGGPARPLDRLDLPLVVTARDCVCE